jgi:hypothetical protein
MTCQLTRSKEDTERHRQAPIRGGHQVTTKAGTRVTHPLPKDSEDY